jgi:FG-GAP repeat
MSRILVTLLALLAAAPVRAASVGLLHAPVPFRGDRFGAALATSPTRILVGAPGTRTSGLAAAGAAHLFDADGNFLRTFIAPYPSASAEFGEALVLVGSDVAVGAHAAPGAPYGAVYLFDGETGKLRVAFPPPSTARGFGTSLAAVGGRVVVSAPGTAVGRADGAGAVYVFLTTGGLLQTLTAPTPAAHAAFGAWVAPVGANVVIGAPGADDGDVSEAGAAWVVDPLSAVTLAALRTPNPTTRGAFGMHAAMVGGDVVVGAPGEEAGGVAGGAAARFAASTGEFRLAFSAPVPVADAAFGGAVATVGSGILFGAPGEDVVGLTRAGRAYLFDATSAGFRRLLESPSPVASGFFGESAATIAEDVLVGEPGGDVGGTPAAGAVHRFALGGSGGGAVGHGPRTTTTSTTVPPPFGCVPTPIFDSLRCRLDGLAALVPASGTKRTSRALLHRLRVARTALVRAQNPSASRRRRLVALARAIAMLRAFERRLSSLRGQRLVPHGAAPSFFAVADPILDDLLLLRATL